MKTVTLDIYTPNNILTFEVVATISKFEEVVADALEKGTAALTLADGGYLILSGMNYVAIEIKSSPPVEE